MAWGHLGLLLALNEKTLIKFSAQSLLDSHWPLLFINESGGSRGWLGGCDIEPDLQQCCWECCVSSEQDHMCLRPVSLGEAGNRSGGYAGGQQVSKDLKRILPRLWNWALSSTRLNWCFALWYVDSRCQKGAEAELEGNRVCCFQNTQPYSLF